jgi:hypothetical protein
VAKGSATPDYADRDTGHRPGTSEMAKAVHRHAALPRRRPATPSRDASLHQGAHRRSARRQIPRSDQTARK